MSTQNIPVIHVEPVDNQKLSITDLVELGEQIFQELQKSKQGQTIDIPEPEPQPEPSAFKFGGFTFTASTIALVGGAILAKKLLF